MTRAGSQRRAPHVQLLVDPGGPWIALADELCAQGFDVRTGEELEPDPALAPQLVLLELACAAVAGRDLALVLPRLSRSGSSLVLALVPRGDADGIQRAFAAGAAGFIDAHDDPLAAAQHVRFALRTLDRRLAPREAGGEEHDRLTGLPTRGRFLRSLAVALARARGAGTNVGVLCLDLDRVRQLSGSLPQADGDELVLAVAQRLRETVRRRDTLAHLGCCADESGLARVAGEEFTLLLEDLRRVEDAARVGRRMIDALAEPFSVAGRELCLSVNVGVASFPSDGQAAEELLKSAETAAYCARQFGPNTLQFHSPEMNARAFERMTFETSLRFAIERDELCLHYQPRVELATGRTVGMEALVRWRHPQLGLVPPARFIPLAEETGLIVPLGEWVVQRACEQNRRWQEQGLAPIRMAVNVSPLQFRQPDLYSSVMRALSRAGLETRWLELELTETSLMSDFESVAATLRRFKQAGVQLSVDDFGTGYSSLSYLRRFPLDALKIDRSFLREVTSNPEDAAIVTAIVLMGKSLKLDLVAEGVETPGQLAFMRIMKCDQAQGYLFSPPVPAEEAERFLRGPTVAAA